MDGKIIKPLLDTRDYKSVTLGNTLEALLVADKSTTMSSASLAVHAGYYDDPEDLPGLAHFCEHLMFLGTAKYPRENEYKQFILTNSGASNAFTSTQITNYHFQIKNSAFPEAVDRFAQFFIAPLFDPGCKDREINAVNSEHEKNTQLDARRILHVSRLTSNKAHPYHKFSTGSKHTLGRSDVRDRLLEFHRDQYCASKMRLVLMGSDMEELEELVRIFEPIENKKLGFPVLDMPVLDQKSSFLQILPLSERRFVRYEFEVPGWKSLKNSENQYFTHLLGHESPGSLYWELKQKGWADGVGACVPFISGETGMLVVTVNLTREGVAHTTEVGEALFEYLAMLRKEGPKEWLFEESKKIKQTAFDYKETPSQIMTEASNLSSSFASRQCAATELVSFLYLMKEYNGAALHKFLACLTPKNLKVTFVAPEVKDECDQVEQHCGTKYSIGELSRDLVETFEKALATGSGRFSLPSKNPYIASDFSVLRPKKTSIPVSDYYKPIKLLPTLFHFPDHMFETPKGMIIVGLNHVEANSSPRAALLTRLACNLWMDAAEKYAYDAEVAGLGLSIHRGNHGVILQVSGFNDKLHVLLNQAYGTLKGGIDPERFVLVLDRLKRSLANAKFNSSFQVIDEYLAAEVDEKQYTLEERLEVLEEDITLEEVSAHMTMLVSEFSPRVLVSGNFTEEKAFEVHDKMVEEFGCEGVYDLKLKSTPVQGSSVSARPSLNPDNQDNCVLYYFESEEVDKARLLAFIVKEPAFTFLRTKKQLGYVARAGFERNFSTAGLSLLTQSAFHTEDVKTLMDEFLSIHMAASMEKMTQSEFDKYVAGFVAQVSKPPKSLMAQTRLVWSKLCNSWGFEGDESAIQLAQSVALDEMKEFYRDLIGQKKRSLCVQINSTKESKRYEIEKDKEERVTANI